MEKIVLAGGCFWGIQEYFSRIKGVIKTVSGYANSTVDNPSYQLVCSGRTNAAEAVEISYDPNVVSLNEILEKMFKVIDPTVMNRQGNDRGTQYRTGIYWINNAHAQEVYDFISKKQSEYSQKIVTETIPLKNFFDAEEYHQDYLKKNPGGYCHIKLD
ncbi:peptide-methionine (S)-S-oxide reductase MsrA [[Mycoplasma] testudinis]|uniref:peptide-methionine (S)-S-oxide reductase MsrA n=1 Tax=[Mycoplasma] testudinis TaxID=33924 RepID=UPI00047F3587|nr:peptide-methionine (S)-S-oxide reductase MsrA [[Mycoplasma] testudinis]